ncbi:MAG: DUF262 domain-containing protein [Sediminibacterium sp.]|nr:DUF262 domain-containing protein [Sediminibacterium sp.]
MTDKSTIPEESRDTIELDKDTELEDSKEGIKYPILDPANSDFEILELPFTIFEYLRKLGQGKIVVQPDFQRNQVWKIDQKSRFIESVLLNYPLPPIYLNETKDSKYMVIDGLQRTTTLNDFYNGQFKLKGLDALPMYEDKYFSSLPHNIQSKFEDKRLNIYALKPSTPLPVIYDLFNRINTGGTPLNKQEVRNCIYIGKSTQLLKTLSEQDYFTNAIDNGVKNTRMKDREVILRYIAFRWFDFHSEYSGDMSEYLENCMKELNKKDDSVINEIADDFKRVMLKSFEIWGDKNFRIPTPSTRGTINIAVFETISRYLSLLSDEFIERNKPVLKFNYSKLIKNSEYLDAVSRSTGTKTRVFTRFRIANQILNENTL